MKAFCQKTGGWLRRRAENVLAALIGVVFAAFVAQIAFRYLFNFPIGWTSELSVVAWLWLVLWGVGLVAKEGEEIRIDLVSGVAGPRTARVMGIIAGISIVTLYAASLPATIRYVTFMKVERSSYLHNALVGRFRGGLAHVNVVQNIILSGMSGSALADAAATGKLMQKMMTQDGKYPGSFAAAVTAAGAVIGPIIPPSIPMVLYALVSDTSVGYLFFGGVVPGLLLGAVQIALIAHLARRRNFPVEKPVPLRELPAGRRMKAPR